MLFGATTAIFLGYYPVALLFGTFLAYQLVVLSLCLKRGIIFCWRCQLDISDRARAMQCISATAVNGGNSLWKVLWK
ncbi:MAG TPA: hypothetical protein VGJ42_02485 [Nitrososphaera sp.]|jgi:hypothetical protein